MLRPLLSAQTDERLVALTRAGNARAFEAIVQRYRGPLVRYAARFLPASRAEDAVQQAFMGAYEALGRSDAAIDLKPWLFRITHNAALDLLRQNGWDHDQIPPDFDGVMRPDQALELGERLRATVAAVKRLPDRQRDAIVLRELEGRSYEEIATALGTNDGAVRQLLNRARTGVRSAATAITPWPLVARAAASPAGANVERAMEVAGVAGVVKAGAAVLATAAVVGGTVAAPIERAREPSKPPRETEAVAAPAAERERENAPATAQELGRPSRDRRAGGDGTRGEREGRRGGGRESERGEDRRWERPGSRRGGDDDRERDAADDRRDEDEDEDERSRDSGPGGSDDRADEPDEESSGSGSGEDTVVTVEDERSSSDSSGPGSGDGLIPTTEARSDNSGPGSVEELGEPDGD